MTTKSWVELIVVVVVDVVVPVEGVCFVFVLSVFFAVSLMITVWVCMYKCECVFTKRPFCYKTQNKSAVSGFLFLSWTWCVLVVVVFFFFLMTSMFVCLSAKSVCFPNLFPKNKIKFLLNKTEVLNLFILNVFSSFLLVF